MEVVRTLQVAKQLDFLGGNNLAGALASLTGGGGNGGMSQGGMPQGGMSQGNMGMGSQGMGSQGMGSSGGMPQPTSMGAGPMVGMSDAASPSPVIYSGQHTGPNVQPSGRPLFP